MPQEIAPIAVRPSTLNGMSERMVVSHYESNYGNAVRTLNAVRGELAILDAGTPPHRLRGLKREELSLMGSVALHELYFANLGGFRRAGPNSGLGRPDWHEVPDAFAAEIATDFGSASAWRREFVGTAQSLAGGSGWVLLTYSRRQKRFWNQLATDHTQAARQLRVRLLLHPAQPHALRRSRVVSVDESGPDHRQSRSCQQHCVVHPRLPDPPGAELVLPRGCRSAGDARQALRLPGAWRSDEGVLS